jgi:ubiquinone/menaquinone biosynthesis C-methylase UbiE
MSSKSFIPALRFKKLTKLYDFFLRITFPENKIKKALIEQLQLKGTETVLDFGCGTGTLSIMIKERSPNLNIIGIDVDDEILAIAEKKILDKNLLIQLKKYDGENLPFIGNQHFDKIVSSLVFHHLPTDTKRQVFSQLYKLIKPGGELHIADFGKPKTVYTKIAFEIFRRFDGEENTRVNAKGLLVDFIKAGGFTAVEFLKSYNTVFGTVDLLKCYSET